MQKYAKHDPKIYVAALSILGASGCRPIQINLQVDPKELAQISYALTGKTPKEVEGAMTQLRKIYHIKNGEFTVEKVEQNGKTKYKIGQTGDSLANEELPPLNDLIDIIQEAAGEDGIATPQEVGAYFRTVVKSYGDKPFFERTDIFNAIYPPPVDKKVDNTAQGNLEGKTETPKTTEQNNETQTGKVETGKIADKTIPVKPGSELEHTASTGVPTNPEPSTGYTKCGVGIGVTLSAALLFLGLYKLYRAIKRA